MASPFNLAKSKIGRDEYNKLIQTGLQRYGGDRDRAVRDANISAGFGNSTAQRFMHAGTPSSSSAGREPEGKAEPGDSRAEEKAEAGRVPTPRDRTSALVEPPSLPGQDQLAGVPPDLMGLPGYDQLKGVPPALLGGGGVPQNAVPPNAAMSMASALRAVPPELLGNNPLGLPPFKPPLAGMMPVPPGLNNMKRNGGYPIAGAFG